MQNFQYWLKKWYPLLIESVIVLFCAFFISFSDTFQEKICPEKFWACRVKELEGDLKVDEWKIKSLELTIKKEKAIGKYNIQAAVNKAQSFGDDINTVINSVEKECEKKLKSLEKNLNYSKKHLEVCQNRLSNAKLKLKKLL
jgi:hypothetical protein